MAGRLDPSGSQSICLTWVGLVSVRRMTKKLVLHTNPHSRGMIAHWMCEETGAEYTVQKLDYGTSMKAPAYLAINPMGKVPAIQHGDTIVTECAAVCAYLADAFPEAGLAPANDQRGDYYRWMFFAAGPLEAAVTNRSLGFEVPADKRSQAGYGSYETTIDTLEHAIKKNDFIAGDSFSAADVYVGSHVGWGMQFGTIEERPTFRQYFARISDRPAHQKIMNG